MPPRTCTLCKRPTAREDCYVRLQAEEHPACRPCWEQLFLDPRRVLRSLQLNLSDQAFPAAPPLSS
jgi:hypothetical protein